MQTETTPAPVSRALLLAFASASVLCALDAALHPAPAAAHGSTATAMALAGSTLRSWLAWQTLAETFFGSILLFRLFSVERHVGSRHAILFVVSGLALSFALSLAAELLRRRDPSETRLSRLPAPFAGAIAGQGGLGWGPSMVCAALLVRHVVEVPERAVLQLPRGWAVSDKGVEALLALQLAFCRPPSSAITAAPGIALGLAFSSAAAAASCARNTLRSLSGLAFSPAALATALAAAAVAAPVRFCTLVCSTVQAWSRRGPARGSDGGQQEGFDGTVYVGGSSAAETGWTDGMGVLLQPAGQTASARLQRSFWNRTGDGYVTVPRSDVLEEAGEANVVAARAQGTGLGGGAASMRAIPGGRDGQENLDQPEDIATGH